MLFIDLKAWFLTEFWILSYGEEHIHIYNNKKCKNKIIDLWIYEMYMLSMCED